MFVRRQRPRARDGRCGRERCGDPAHSAHLLSVLSPRWSHGQPSHPHFNLRFSKLKPFIINIEAFVVCCLCSK